MNNGSETTTQVISSSYCVDGKPHKHRVSVLKDNMDRFYIRIKLISEVLLELDVLFQSRQLLQVEIMFPIKSQSCVGNDGDNGPSRHDLTAERRRTERVAAWRGPAATTQS
ncbi:hypothetical protein J6590_012937 [Homalodisca vitripennis]|nr:hypothetical protein J6590_012937 [Homalodisca vitripennis]